MRVCLDADACTRSATSLSPDDAFVRGCSKFALLQDSMLLVATDLRKRFPAVGIVAGAAAGAERARSVAADGDVAKPVVKNGAEGPVAWVTCDE